MQNGAETVEKIILGLSIPSYNAHCSDPHNLLQISAKWSHIHKEEHLHLFETFIHLPRKKSVLQLHPPSRSAINRSTVH